MVDIQRVFSFAAGSAPVSGIGSIALGSVTPFVKLLLAVFNSILEVFLLCAAGYILARHGILDKRTQKQINRLNVSLFTPALLFSKVAFFLTPEKLRELWIVPVFFTIVTLASMFVGRVLGWTFRLSNSQRSFVTASAMFMNSNALPIALMQSLVLSVPDLAWGDDDNTDAMMGRALTYLTMYSTLGMVIRYSYGISLLSRADTTNVSLTSAPFPSTSTTTTPGPGPGPVKNISYLQQGEDDEHAPLLGSTSRPSSPSFLHPRPPLLDVRVEQGDETLHTHPSSSTLYEPYNEHEHDQEHHRAASSSKFTNSPETIGSTVPLPVLPTHAAAAAVAHSNAHGQLNGLGINGVDVAGPAFAAAGAGAAPAIAASLQPRQQRPQPKRANTHTSFYNSFPNSPNESREDLPEWEGSSSSSSSSGSNSSLSAAGQEHEHEQGEEEEECTATTADEAERDLEAAESGLIPPDHRKRRRRGRHHREHHHHPSHPHTQSPGTLKFKHLAHSLRHALHRLLRTLHSVLHTLNNFMTVPLWAALASLLVACIEPLKHTLEKHLTPLNDAVATCGRCAVPLTLVVLGGYFFEETGVGQEGMVGAVGEEERRREEKKKSSVWRRIKDSFLGFFPGFGKSKTSANGNANVAKANSSSSRPGESKTVVLSILARMVLTPLLLVPLILMATKGDWHAIFEDPVFVTVNTILLCSPPALTLAQITAKVSGDAFERLISRTIFWSYCVMTPPVMILCVLAGLWLAEF